MTEQEFIIEQQKAVERMKKMAGHSNIKKDNTPQAPPNAKTDKTGKPDEKIQNCKLPFEISNLNIPFLSSLKNDKDAGLILGLILILFCENSDRLLLLALIYILL